LFVWSSQVFMAAQSGERLNFVDVSDGQNIARS